MEKVVVDSNVLIRYLAKEKQAVEILETLIKKRVRILVPAIVIAEILSYSKLTETDRLIIKSFILNFEIVPIDFGIAEIAGILRSKYQIKLPDALISATAIYFDGALLTFNQRDFKKIRELKIFKI
jgi:predicted nucleic acid-binding protein